MTDSHGYIRYDEIKLVASSMVKCFYILVDHPSVTIVLYVIYCLQSSLMTYLLLFSRNTTINKINVREAWEIHNLLNVTNKLFYIMLCHVYKNIFIFIVSKGSGMGINTSQCIIYYFTGEQK